VLWARGKYADAETLYREALAMRRRLYPKQDHPDLAASLNNLANVLKDQGKHAGAEAVYRAALAMYRRLARDYAAVRSEGEALTLAATHAPARDGFLSNAWASKAAAATVYPEVWSSKAALGRVYEQRALAARAVTTDPRAAALLAHLTDVRRRRADLLLAPKPTDPAFRSAFQVDAKLFEMTRRGERVGAGALSPMVMTGLVFAGANNPKTPGRGIVTGEALVDLDLSGLDLAVLSACETGLGETAGGEGTFGLQRAFHLAGTRDVVASLWKVPDRPTAALMALFYRNLWDKDLPPIEALRQAQLDIYRHPEKIPELAAEFRGKFVEVPGTEEAPVQPAADGKAHPRLWAAFTLSGLGR
jgi:tetratricopeptide (TPR) repeat protein